MIRRFKTGDLRSLLPQDIPAIGNFLHLRRRLSPNGPCYTFRDPAGVRLAIYENQRPNVDEDFADRIDREY